MQQTDQELAAVEDPEASDAIRGAVIGGVEDIRRYIEDRILDGTLAGGARLKELPLADRLGVSRGIIREAVRLLEQAGLVTVVHNHGVFIRQLSLEEVLDLYDVRAGLARSVGRLVATRITKDELDELNGLFDRMEEARTALDADRYETHHLEFHERLLAYTRNPLLISLHEQIEKQMRLFLCRSVVSLARLRHSNRYHRLVLDAIVEGDPEAAAEALEKDILHGRERVLDSINRDPG